MQAYLDLLSAKKIKLETLSPVFYDVGDAAKAYDALKGEGEKPLLALLTYANQTVALARRIDMRKPVSKEDKINVAIVGASSFAQGMHLPNLVTLRKSYEIHAVMSRTGANARAVATQYSAAYCTSDYDEILNDEKVDLVLIATRHNLHADMVLKALRAGKNVFVEKPLALNEKELREIEEFYESVTTSIGAPILMTGFNRRFSPAIKTVQEIVRNRTTPLIVNYRMNAGFIPRDHWVQGSEGGGRNIGEACHIYDLFNALVGGKKVISIHADSISPANDLWCKTDNFIATVKYEDGSVCSLTYTAMGSKSYPKERMEVFFDGRVVAMDDYLSVAVHGAKHPGWKSNTVQKGQTQELEALAIAFSNGEWPISLEEQLQATRISLEVEKQITK
jgi:predicted dehydrogenase